MPCEPAGLSRDDVELRTHKLAKIGGCHWCRACWLGVLDRCCRAWPQGHPFDAADEIGGQFNLAKRVPGKEEFHETLRYYSKMLDKLDVDVRLGERVSAADLEGQGFDHVVVATGITPRVPDIKGIDHPMVVGYIDAIMGRKPIGKKVAVVGAGGIGFDVTDLITHEGPSAALDIDVFAREWGIDFENHPRGGVTGLSRKSLERIERFT